MAVVAALGWNSFFVEVFDRLSPTKEIWALFFYALVVTVLAIGIGFAFFEVNKKKKQNGNNVGAYGG